MRREQELGRLVDRALEVEAEESKLNRYWASEAARSMCSTPRDSWAPRRRPRCWP